MKSHRGISFLSVQESSFPSVEASLSLTFHISPLAGRSAGKRPALCRQWCLWRGCSGLVWGSPFEGLANGPERGRLGGSAKCPLSSSRSCETKWSLPRSWRGLRWVSKRLGPCGWYTVGMPVPCLGNK